MGRRPIGGVAMTGAERWHRWADNKRKQDAIEEAQRAVQQQIDCSHKGVHSAYFGVTDGIEGWRGQCNQCGRLIIFDGAVALPVQSHLVARARGRAVQPNIEGGGLGITRLFGGSSRVKNFVRKAANRANR